MRAKRLRGKPSDLSSADKERATPAELIGHLLRQIGGDRAHAGWHRRDRGLRPRATTCAYGALEQRRQDRPCRANAQRQRERRRHLCQHFGFAEHDRLEPRGDAEEMTRRFGADEPSELRVDRVIATARLDEQSRHRVERDARAGDFVGGHAIQLDAMTRGHDHELAERERRRAVARRYARERRGGSVRGESETLDDREWRRRMTQPHEQHRHSSVPWDGCDTATMRHGTAAARIRSRLPMRRSRGRAEIIEMAEDLPALTVDVGTCPAFDHRLSTNHNRRFEVTENGRQVDGQRSRRRRADREEARRSLRVSSTASTSRCSRRAEPTDSSCHARCRRRSARAASISGS